MSTSILIAKYLGPVLLLTGFLMALNKPLARDIREDVLKSPALIFIAGLMALLLGLTILIFHNIWVADWPVIITIYGWMSLIAGVVRITAPDAVRKIAEGMGRNDRLMLVLYCIIALLGIFLTQKGYLT